MVHGRSTTAGCAARATTVATSEAVACRMPKRIWRAGDRELSRCAGLAAFADDWPRSRRVAAPGAEPDWPRRRASTGSRSGRCLSADVSVGMVIADRARRFDDAERRALRPTPPLVMESRCRPGWPDPLGRLTVGGADPEQRASTSSRTMVGSSDSGTRGCSCWIATEHARTRVAHSRRRPSCRRPIRSVSFPAPPARSRRAAPVASGVPASVLRRWPMGRERRDCPVCCGSAARAARGSGRGRAQAD